MPKIKATCAECGDVDLRPRDVKLVNYIGSGAVYSFLCPNTEHDELTRMQYKPANLEVLGLLDSVGVKPINIERDAEFDDPVRYDKHAHLTNNDLVRFIIHLNNDDLDDKLSQIADSNL